jgi:hypothetical protein
LELEGKMKAIIFSALMVLASITTVEADDMVLWSKQGANKIELERTKASCESSQLEAAIAPPLAWFPIFELCMRANGWVQIPKTPSAAPTSGRRATP